MKVRPKILAWMFILAALLHPVALAAFGAWLSTWGSITSPLSFSTFGGTVTLWERAVLTGLLNVALLVWGASLLFRNDRELWKRGARYQVRSVEEAAVMLSLSSDEQQTLSAHRITWPGIVAAACVGLTVGGIVATSRVLTTTDVVLLIAGLLAINWWAFSALAVARRRYVAALVLSPFAREHGYTLRDLAQPWYNLLWSDNYYRQILALDESPFDSRRDSV